ncbi:phosphopantetheine-binding protein, partial [Mycolicibacterium elephantis]
FSAAAQVSILDGWRDPVPIGVVGDVYDHVIDEDGAHLRARGKRGRWTEDGRLEVVDVVDAPRPSAPAGPAEPARTDTERALAAILADVLEVPVVNRTDGFFELGGDSILAVQVAARARDAGLALTARMVFEHPTVSELAAKVDEAGETAPDTDTRHEPMSTSGLSPDELAAVTSMWTASRDGAP